MSEESMKICLNNNHKIINNKYRIKLNLINKMKILTMSYNQRKLQFYNLNKYLRPHMKQMNSQVKKKYKIK